MWIAAKPSCARSTVPWPKPRQRGSKPIPAVLWEPGGTVPGQATLVAELMAQAGFANFSAQRGLGQSERLPLERMLADPPRVILAVARTAGPEGDRLLFHPALAALGHTARAAGAQSHLLRRADHPRMLARLVAVRHQLEQHQQDIRP
jgi:iron complex transport system substrate-binding protein